MLEMTLTDLNLSTKKVPRESDEENHQHNL